MAELFPMFLKLQGRRCVVVGAGRIAEQKLDSLLLAGASVRVIAPATSARIRQLAEGRQIEWIDREFAAADLDGAYLVIAATGDSTVNEDVFRAAEARGVLCNSVDEPDRCHFYYPAVVRRGDLQIAISTAGNSPALAQRIRKELEKQFAPEYAAWLAWLGRVRNLYFTRKVRVETRTAALHGLARADVYQRFAARHANARRERHG
ncbi:MAG: precorrin-2 dehydrogenase/sirohydrochlorin ferrochelatase family protein [Terriglobales bacterium]